MKGFNMSDKYSAYHSEFPIFEDLHGKQMGVQYKGEDGFTGKIGADNTYRKNGGSAFTPERTRYQVALAQKLNDFKVYGDIAGKKGWDPTGRVGLSYQPGNNTKLDAQIYNYDKSRDSFMDRATLQLKAEQQLTDNLKFKAMARAKKDGLGDYRAGLQYTRKF